MRGDEARVVAAFVTHLEADGWTVETEVKWVDVVAHRGTETIYAEAKGLTSEPGLDINTLYGQLLSRMPDAAQPGTRYAVVVRDVHRKFAFRVPTRVRELLDIDVYLVTDDDVVTRAD